VKTQKSANDADFALSPSPVRLLQLNKGAVRVKRSQERSKTDELWLGDAFDPLRQDDPAIPIYVRLGDGGAMVAELVCGCLARALELPAPEVFLVSVKPGSLPKSKIASSKNDTLCVATRDLGGSSFTQLLNTENADAAALLLTEWTELSTIAAFDEWTANPDRNMGNLIYASQALHIIDHADAFGGRDRDLYPLAELTTQTLTNRLGEMLNGFEIDKRDMILKDIQQWITTTAAPLDLANVIQCANIKKWNSDIHDGELLDFLKQRLTVTHSLLCQRLGHPQLNLQTQHC
jgi:hypothetical protein